MKPGILNNASTGSLSPPSGPSLAGISKSTSLPIARSNNPAWEKPERARTSHACEPCRERKTKCDGSRPACRRCLHTGTACFYGYGKGWRKRKTAEDLTATSRRLARYENLFNDIMHMVSPEVRVLIEDARDSSDPDGTGSNHGSETAEETHLQPPALPTSDTTMSNSSSRIILPLPVPSLAAGTSPLGPTVSRSSTSSGAFDTVALSSAVNGSNLQQSQRLSPDSAARMRLPSITAVGLLIDAEAGDQSPATLHRSHDSISSHGQDGVGMLPVSPIGHTSSLGEPSRQQQFSPG